MKNPITHTQVIIGDKTFGYPECLPLPQIGSVINYNGYKGEYSGKVTGIEHNILEPYSYTDEGSSIFIKIILE